MSTVKPHAKDCIDDCPSPTPVPLYLLTISPDSSPASPKERRDAGPSYVSPSGTTTGDCKNAAIYTIAQSGQLMTAGGLISTTGLVPNAPFAPSPNIAAISTTFSTSNGVLYWNNTAFVGNQALFCQTSSTVEAVFNGQLPTGCPQVTLSLLLLNQKSCPSYGISTSTIVNLPTGTSSVAASVTASSTSSSESQYPTETSSYPNTLSGNGVVADLIGGYFYESEATVLSGVNENIISLDQCLDFCVGYTYFGVSGGIPYQQHF